ncbi:MAG: T9SS type A sorting domain-containing protein [Flavobacteriales bacterium]|jgi:hypothetical protein|nr:T9SS type A sorting domain-containing protein [Flavobacteriales bacterium]
MKKIFFILLIPILSYAQPIRFDYGQNLAINENIVCSFQDFYHPEPIHYIDVNGDGKLDALTSGNAMSLFNRQSFLYIQDSVGYYTNTAIPFKYSNVNAAFGDVDNDGDVDLIVSGTQQSGTYSTKLLLNDGNGDFSTEAPIPVAHNFWGKFQFADVDNDNDLDFFYVGFDVGNNAQSKLCLNDGNGNFSVSNTVTFAKVHSGGIAFADIDGDNDLDLFYTGKFYSNSYAYLYTNDGNGNYSQVSGTSFTGVTKPNISFEDVDGDNDLDLFYTGLPDGSTPSFITKYYNNDGSGGFSDNTTAPFYTNEHTSFHFEDIDNDNSKELIFINNNQEDGINNEIYTNDGSGNFTLNTTFYLNTNLHTITFSDLDNDNDLDITDAKSATFYLNDGNGNFYESKGISEGTIALGDIDGDNDLDILVSGLNTSYLFSGLTPSLSEDTLITTIYLNNGIGGYTPIAGLPFEGLITSKAKFFDADGDLDLDLFILGKNTNNIKVAQLFLNDGNGNFTLNTSNFDGVTGDFDLGDYDGDNDLDILVIGTNNIPNLTVTMYANDGNANYTNMGDLNLFQLYDGAVQFADIDGDNDLDLYLGGYVALGVTPGILFTNDGNGNYSPLDTLNGAYKGDAVFADIDGDNDLDLLTSDRYEGSTLYKNDGNGVFSVYNDSTLNTAENGELSFGDLDQDGDLDLFITGGNSSSAFHTSYYTNDGNGNYALLIDSVFTDVAYSSIAIGNLDNDTLEEVIYLGRKDHNYSIKSVVKIHQVIGLANTGSESVYACDDYVWNNDSTYSSTGSYSFLFTNEQGCDSLATLHLTIGTLETVITFANDTISPTFTGDTYQWIDCNNGTALTNETDSIFIPTTNGTYALVMTQGSCSDTSNCILITHLSIDEHSDNQAIVVPNPGSDYITVQTSNYNPVDLTIFNLEGKMVQSHHKINSSAPISITNLPQGIYYIRIVTAHKIETLKFVKQ